VPRNKQLSQNRSNSSCIYWLGDILRPKEYVHGRHIRYDIRCRIKVRKLDLHHTILREAHRGRLECRPTPVFRDTGCGHSIECYKSENRGLRRIPFLSSFCEHLRIKTPTCSPPKQSDRMLFCRFRLRMSHSWYFPWQVGHPRTNGKEVFSVNCRLFGCSLMEVGE
jgi:hypothetical protein